MQITNSLEWAEWGENPVQVVLCDACGHEQCASGGYVHVSRWDKYILWSPPQRTVEAELSNEDYDPPRVMRTLGVLAIPVETWRDWAAVVRQLPHPDHIMPSNHAAVADAWVLGPGRSTESIAAYLRQGLVGGDTLEKDQAIALVGTMLASLRSKQEAPFEAPLLSATATNARIETLYFDGPSELDWPALAFMEDEILIALDRQRIARIQP